MKYAESFPATVGFTTTNYQGTTRGSPEQSYPKVKGNAVVDWDIGMARASFTGRYIKSVKEADGKTLDNTFYGDVQVTFAPGWLENRLGLTVGVNNVFNQDPPACFSCTGPNYDPTTYDVPGQFGYIRLSWGL